MAGPPPESGTSPERPRPRRWPWALLAVVGLVAGGVGVGVALDQRGVAAGWRDRALVLEEQRAELADQVDDAGTRLDAAVQALERSERDVRDLEVRLRELADAKAQAEDVAVTGEVERAALAEVAGRVTAAVEALDACVARLFELQAASVEAFNLAARGDPVDVVPLNEQAAVTTTFCNDARAAAARAGAAAQALLGAGT